MWKKRLQQYTAGFFLLDDTVTCSLGGLLA